MKFKDELAWDKWKEADKDDYGGEIIAFAERWADAMERELAKGGPLLCVGDVAPDCAREADTEGISGFMYSAAVAILAGAWERGDDLRRWHNLKSQIGNEGERANESGRVLNTAILNVG